MVKQPRLSRFEQDLRSWRRFVPFGLAIRDKPRHFREMWSVLWENRGKWRYAWRILRHGVCDGCSLGPMGLRDNVIPGTHLCMTRLKLLRLNTMDAMKESDWSDIERLRTMTSEQLRKLGRVPYPLIRRPGDKGFSRISWDEAADLAAKRFRETSGERTGMFVTSRGLTNETYYTLQKLARIAGTPNIDSCARLCHAASTSGLKATIGFAAPTCSLKDMIGTDLLILFGTDLANNQPVTTKYMHYAKQQGTKILVINPFREPGLERYWVPSVTSSALFGTKLMDEFYQVNPGGDMAFMNAVLKILKEIDGFNKEFIEQQTEGFEDLLAFLDTLDINDLVKECGIPLDQIRHFAGEYAKAKTAVIVYSMGLTQHKFGVQNVKSVVNLALARGMLGREKCGIIPIRGHSGVQGTAECGADAAKLPGGVELTPENIEKFETAWNHPIPHVAGLRAAHLVDESAQGNVDLLYLVGGNHLETLPDPENARRGLSAVKTRIHQDIIFNTSTLLDAKEEVLVLPAQTRYEQKGGGTSTNTERRIRFTPEIHGHRIGEAKPEWEIPALIGKKLVPDRPDLFDYNDSQDVRDEMEKLMPLYKGIGGLQQEKQWVQWGGENLGSDGTYPTPSGKAAFSTLETPKVEIPEGKFFLVTRRGKQFNSITYGEKDPLSGADNRRVLFFADEDMEELGLSDGDPVVLQSDQGEMKATAHLGPCKPRHIQAFWPECNVLLERKYDPDSYEPDYNTFVTVEKIPEGALK